VKGFQFSTEPDIVGTAEQDQWFGLGQEEEEEEEHLS